MGWVAQADLHLVGGQVVDAHPMTVDVPIGFRAPEVQVLILRVMDIVCIDRVGETGAQGPGEAGLRPRGVVAPSGEPPGPRTSASASFQATPIPPLG